MPRLFAILLLYLTILGTLTSGALLLIGPLTTQVQGLTTTLPTLLSTESDAQTQIDHFFQQQGLPLSVAGLRDQIAGNLTTAGSSLLGGTLAALTGLVGLVTDLFLVLAITFYLLLDGRSMHTWALRLLPETPARTLVLHRSHLESGVGRLHPWANHCGPHRRHRRRGGIGPTGRPVPAGDRPAGLSL